MMKNIVYIFFLSLVFVHCAKTQDLNSITTQDLKIKLSKGDKIQLLDVRTPEEVAEGSIETAIFINFFDDDFSKKTLKNLSKEKPVYVYCRSGNRSAKAAKILEQQGFKTINVLGGYNQWKLEN